MTIQSTCHYELQAFQATETIAILKRKLCCINKLLVENIDNPYLRRELSQVELELRITVNELEHIDYMIQQSQILRHQVVKTKPARARHFPAREPS